MSIDLSVTRPKLSAKLRHAASRCRILRVPRRTFWHRSVYSRPDEGDQGSRGECPDRVIGDAILEAAVGLRIRAGHSPDLQRRSIWENDVCPDDKHPRLTEGDLGIIAPEELCSLRNEQLMAGGAVIDGLAHLGADTPGQVGIDAGDQYCRNDGTTFQLIARQLRNDLVR